MLFFKMYMSNTLYFGCHIIAMHVRSEISGERYKKKAVNECNILKEIRMNVRSE
jgi:hypothetical protein